MNGHQGWAPIGRATLLGAVLLLAGLTGSAFGVTRVVPEDFPTIQSAIDASAEGDTVLLSPGTFTGPGNRNISFRGMDLVVKSSHGPESTIIDCEYEGRGFYLNESQSRAARIEGITIWRGSAMGFPGASGGGIFCELAGPSIVNCRILECQALFGGGLALILFRGVLDRCQISGCLANTGGGLYFMMGEAEFTNCLISGNGTHIGGGVHFGGVGPNRLVGCTIVANSVGAEGAGIRAGNRVELIRCIVRNNCGEDEITCPLGGDFYCCNIDPAGLDDPDDYVFEDCINEDPQFCAPEGCGWHTYGDWSLDIDSPCLPENSPCGELIGALGWGCGSIPEGACCYLDGTCAVVQQDECEQGQGVYQGDGTDCAPNPCEPTAVAPSTWGRIKASFR